MILSQYRPQAPPIQRIRGGPLERLGFRSVPRSRDVEHGPFVIQAELLLQRGQRGVRLRASDEDDVARPQVIGGYRKVPCDGPLPPIPLDQFLPEPFVPLTAGP